MKVLVTGGAGFIGGHLVERLVRDGCDVTVLDDLSTGHLRNLAAVEGRIRFIESDLREPDAVASAMEGCEVVFHEAALASVPRSIKEPALVTDVNVRGMLGLLIAARDAGVRRFVFASSSSVYGDTPTLPKDEGMFRSPLSPYAASKASGEMYGQSFQAAYGLEFVPLRYFNVYGPRQDPNSQYAAVIPIFASLMSQGKAPVIYGDGEQTRDFTYVEDVVEANMLAAEVAHVDGRPINLGAGDQITINDLAREIAKLTGFDGKVRYEPARNGDIVHTRAATDRATEVLGWTPKIDLADGLARTVASFNPTALAGEK